MRSARRAPATLSPGRISIAGRDGVGVKAFAGLLDLDMQGTSTYGGRAATAARDMAVIAAFAAGSAIARRHRHWSARRPPDRHAARSRGRPASAARRTSGEPERRRRAGAFTLARCAKAAQRHARRKPFVAGRAIGDRCCRSRRRRRRPRRPARSSKRRCALGDRMWPPGPADAGHGEPAQ